MSQTFEDFYNFISKNSRIQEKLIGISDRETLLQELVSIGKDNGFELEPNALGAWLKEKQDAPEGELSEADLDQVSGGSGSWFHSLW
jgi:hypothetical protein